MNKEKMLYHYCSTRKMANIIRGGQLWMSDVRKSNDYEEIQLFYPHILYKAECLYEQAPFDFVYKNLKNMKAVRRIFQDVDCYIQESFDNGSFTSYVACFCENGDDLSLWRGYAGNGEGCAIGFSYDGLVECCKKSNGGIILKKVEYCEEDKINELVEENAQKLVVELKNLEQDIHKFFPTDVTDEQRNCAYAMFLFSKTKRIMMDSLMYKRYDFKEEKEWRMYIPNVGKIPEWVYGDTKQLFREIDPVTELLYKKIDFYETDSDIISFYPLEIKNESTSLIKEIICGPKNNISLADLHLFMEQQGFSDVKYSISGISYR